MFARGCIAPGWCWQVDVNHVPWNYNPATAVIESINVSVVSPSQTDLLSLGPATWAASTYNPTQQNEVIVMPTSVAAAGMDLSLQITRWASGSRAFFNVHICSGVVSDGIVLNGCAGSARRQLAPSHRACMELPEPFRSSCNYDLELTDEPLFAEAALNASRMCDLKACGCGDDSTCRDCLGVPHGDAVMLACGCNDDKSCRDCKGEPYGKDYSCRDCRGVMHGPDRSCFDCKDGGAVVGCDGVCGSGLVIGGCDKKCGSTAVVGCDGVCGSGLVYGCDKRCGSGLVIGTYNRMKSFENFLLHLHHKISRMKKKFSGLVVFNLF
jgi:hypothetical protein